MFRNTFLFHLLVFFLLNYVVALVRLTLSLHKRYYIVHCNIQISSEIWMLIKIKQKIIKIYHYNIIEKSKKYKITGTKMSENCC